MRSIILPIDTPTQIKRLSSSKLKPLSKLTLSIPSKIVMLVSQFQHFKYTNNKLLF